MGHKPRSYLFVYILGIMVVSNANTFGTVPIWILDQIVSVWSFAEDVDALEVVFGLLTAPTENDLKLAASILLYPLKGGKKKQTWVISLICPCLWIIKHPLTARYTDCLLLALRRKHSISTYYPLKCVVSSECPSIVGPTLFLPRRAEFMIHERWQPTHLDPQQGKIEFLKAYDSISTRKHMGLVHRVDSRNWFLTPSWWVI